MKNQHVREFVFYQLDCGTSLEDLGEERNTHLLNGKTILTPEEARLVLGNAIIPLPDFLASLVTT